MKREGKYHGCGEEYHMEKRERGSNIIFPIILRRLGRISNGEDGNFWEENQNGMGKNIKLSGTLYTTAINVERLVGR